MAGSLLFGALLYPSRIAELHARRGALKAADAAGIMDSTRELGGQILGYNYYRHPRSVHAAVGLLSTGVGYAPALVLSLMLTRRMLGDAHATRCGRCSARLHNLAEPRCPTCGEAF
jgi:hypothetical protein